MLRYLYVSTAGDECVLFWSYGRVRHLLRYSFKTLTVVSAAALRHCNLDDSQEEQYQPRSTPVTARADYRTRLTNNCLCAAAK